MNAAISLFGDTLSNSIKVYQAGDKVTSTQKLHQKTKSHFYVQEQKELDPEFAAMLESHNGEELGNLLLQYMDRYKNG